MKEKVNVILFMISFLGSRLVRFLSVLFCAVWLCVGKGEFIGSLLVFSRCLVIMMV